MGDTGMLDGKVAVILGGAGRIGSAAAAAFMEGGARVLLVDKSQDKLDVALGGLASRFTGQCSGLCLEVRTEEEARALADAAKARYGKADILLNAPAYISRAPFLEHSIAEVDLQWQVNFRAVYMASREIARLMAEGGGGKIINIASIGGLRPEKGHAGHCAVKAALIALTKVMALELAERNIQVNVIAPGPTETRPFSSDYYLKNPSVLRDIESRTPAGRIGAPADHAGLLVFLASSRSDWITGQVIMSDGGLGLA